MTQENNTTPVSNVMAAIAAERERQIANGYDAVHDDGHARGEILWTRWGAVARINDALDFGTTIPEHYKKLLTQAAALIIAEIERVGRASADREVKP